MREIFIQGDTLPEAYHRSLLELWTNGEIIGCSDYNQDQKECSMTMVIEKPTQEPRVSKLMIGGHHELMQYELEVLDGILDFMVGADKNTWEYTYHQRYAHQLPYIIRELKRNAETRRAIMNIRDFEIDSTNADPACWQSGQFFIRDGKLHMKVLFRSNDAGQAAVMNMWAFIRLQEKVAGELGVEVGSYTHRANSYHIYSKDFPMLEKWVDTIRNQSTDNLVFDYADMYRDLMEAEIPSIMEMVKAQKKKYGIE